MASEAPEDDIKKHYEDDQKTGVFSPPFGGGGLADVTRWMPREKGISISSLDALNSCMHGFVSCY